MELEIHVRHNIIRLLPGFFTIDGKKSAIKTSRVQPVDPDSVSMTLSFPYLLTVDKQRITLSDVPKEEAVHVFIFFADVRKLWIEAIFRLLFLSYLIFFSSGHSPAFFVFFIMVLIYSQMVTMAKDVYLDVDQKYILRSRQAGKKDLQRW